MAAVVHPNNTFEPNDEDRKLFVGGLSWNTTEDDLFQYFNQFGSIANVNIKYNPEGKSRGFGFVTFTSNVSIDTVLENGPHTVNNKMVDPRKAKTRNQARAECKKIFLGGLDINLPEKDIRNIFGKFGKIESIELPYDNLNQCRRRFGFVVFENPESAAAACKEPKQLVGQTEVDVRLSKPNNNNNNGNGGNGGFRQNYNNLNNRGNNIRFHGYPMNNDAGDYNNSGRVYSYDSSRNVNYNMDNMYRMQRY